jgi:hypothetical protein
MHPVVEFLTIGPRISSGSLPHDHQIVVTAVSSCHDGHKSSASAGQSPGQRPLKNMGVSSVNLINISFKIQDVIACAVILLGYSLRVEKQCRLDLDWPAMSSLSELLQKLSPCHRDADDRQIGIASIARFLNSLKIKHHSEKRVEFRRTDRLSFDRSSGTRDFGSPSVVCMGEFNGPMSFILWVCDISAEMASYFRYLALKRERLIDHHVQKGAEF